jgi:hypothetical protein
LGALMVTVSPPRRTSRGPRTWNSTALSLRAPLKER